MYTRPFFHMCAWTCAAVLAVPVLAQEPAPRITFEDALARARRYAGQVQSANLAVLLAGEDTVQARAARLPSVSAFSQFIYTEPNGTDPGVFVANDGPHVYTEQAVVHQELLSLVRHGEIDRAIERRRRTLNRERKRTFRFTASWVSTMGTLVLA